MSDRISIAFVDDHPLFLDGLYWFFSTLSEFDILASGENADEALTIADTFRPDVLVIDLRMPGDPFAAIKSISTAHPTTRIVTFTALADVDCAIRALEAGAGGYVLKGATTDELSRAIHVVLSGEKYITPAFAPKVISALREPRPSVQQSKIKLNVREAQILRLLLNGLTNKEIGVELALSEKTVSHYMTLLMRKLNARNRVEAVVLARNLGSAWLDDVASGRIPRQLH